MEYRLNKIDTDLRQKINEASSEGRIHGVKNITINKDKDDNQKEKPYENKSKLKKYDKKSFIVNATKSEELEIEAYKDEPEKGSILDVKR